MKKILLTLVICGFTLFSNAQTIGVEKSIFGIQTGVFGTWVHHEAKLSPSVVLRSELGYDATYIHHFSLDEPTYIFALVLRAEPKWYYNLNKRHLKSKRTDGNSGDFLSLPLSYHPDLLMISNGENISVRSGISIIPTWGIRRNIGKRFNYEAGIGLGYIYSFPYTNSSFRVKDNFNVRLNLHLRIGYKF